MLYDITYVWNLKKNSTDESKHKQKHPENKLMDTKRERMRGKDKRGKWA